MNYYLYQITNLVNAKIYVGVHKTRDMNDGYMGSGKVILSAIKKHGTNNFKKVILETFADAKSMYAREKEVVTEDFLSRKDVYNLRRGGTGGFDYINKAGLNVDIKTQQKLDPTLFDKIQRNAKIGFKRFMKNVSEDWLKERSNKAIVGAKAYCEKHGHPFSKLNHSEEFQKLRKSKFKKIKHQQGKKNSQFGTMWITNSVMNKKIKTTEAIPSGWSNGRIKKERKNNG